MLKITIGDKMKEDLEAIARFCERFEVRLVKSIYTNERGFRERMYFFSDNLGGYTIEGVRNSLE